MTEIKISYLDRLSNFRSKATVLTVAQLFFLSFLSPCLPADFPPTGKGMNRKTAGAKRRRDKPERIPTQLGGSEGFYLQDLLELNRASD